MQHTITSWFAAFFLLVFGLSGTAQAATTHSKSMNVAKEAIEMLDNIQESPESSLPLYLLENAKAVAIVPKVIKIGLVVGGRRGTGLISVRQEDGSWSYPAYVNVTGGSVGFQIGLSSTDIVLVFRTHSGVDKIVRNKFTLGADAAVAAGPVGRNAQAATDAQLKASIYSYSRARGLFAGVSLDGTALTINNKYDQAVYGKGITARRIFEGGVDDVPDVLLKFRQHLTRYSTP